MKPVKFAKKLALSEITIAMTVQKFLSDSRPYKSDEISLLSGHFYVCDVI